MSRYIYFISDLHLNSEEPAVAEGFIAFLRAQTKKAEALYILGDFFEAWIGDDAPDPLEKNIIRELHHATQAGLPIYFIHGNRDFLIGKKFAKQTGVTILKDPSIIEIYGKKWMISHGDYLCTEDHGHMKLRKFTSNRCAQFLFLQLPIGIRRKIARKLKGVSRGNKKPLNMMDVHLETLKTQMRQYAAQRIIHGHTHEGKIHEFTLDESPATRIVLGDWTEVAKILRCSEDGKFNLETLALPPAHSV